MDMSMSCLVVLLLVPVLLASEIDVSSDRTVESAIAVSDEPLRSDRLKAQKFFEDAKAATKERDEFLKETAKESPDTRLRHRPRDTQKTISERNRAISDLYRKAAELGHVEAKYELALMLRTAASEFRNNGIRKIEEELFALLDKEGQDKKLVALTKKLRGWREEEGQDTKLITLEGEDRKLRIEALKEELQLLLALGGSKAIFQHAAEQAESLEAYDRVKQAQTGIEEALKWMLEAAKDEHVDALYEIGMFYVEPESPLKRDVDEGLHLLQLAAEKGNAVAPMALAMLYREGEKIDWDGPEDGPWLIEKNQKLSAKYLKQAADQKDPRAMHMLGQNYCDGLGVERNDKKCFELMMQAAKTGHVVAQRDVALMFLNGKGTAKDQVLFLHYLRKSAEQHYPRALYDLGMCYYKAIAVEEDKEEAHKWFKEAADRGHVDACHAVGVHALQNKDYTTAKKYLEMAAKQGHERAMHILGDLYLEGLGMEEPSREKAIELYKMAHRRELVVSMEKLVALGVDLDEPLNPSVWYQEREEMAVPVAGDYKLILSSS